MAAARRRDDSRGRARTRTCAGEAERAAARAAWRRRDRGPRARRADRDREGAVVIGTMGRVRVFAYCQPVDMRNGFEGLSALVTSQLQRDPLSGALFLFTNKTRTRAKVLHFDGTGLCIFAKRLERGRFVAL